MTNCKGLLGVVVCLAVAGLAFATFDPESGTGFVPKGWVQSSFGWNNAELQAHAEDLTFGFYEEVTQSAVCQHGNAKPQKWTRYGARAGTIEGEVEYDPRLNPQENVTGFILTGLGECDEAFGPWANETKPGRDDIIPPCLNEKAQGWKLVAPIEEIVDGPWFYVNCGGQSVELLPQQE